MAVSKTQSIPYFSRINHIYYLIEAIRTKNYKYICRHFLWFINNQSNEPITPKAIRSTLSELTADFGIDNQSIGDALCDMAKSGEIERLKGKHNQVRWNDDVTNQSRWTMYLPNYAGNPLRRYNEAEQLLVDKLMKYVRPAVPRSKEDLEHSLLIHKYDKVVEEYTNMERLLQNLQEQLAVKDRQLDQLMKLLTRITCGEEVAETEIKGQLLKLVPKNG